MTRNGQPPDPTTEELDVFLERQRKVPSEKLPPFAGKQVAWSIDDARIIASGNDLDELEEKVVAAGVAPNRVVFGFINDPEVSYL